MPAQLKSAIVKAGRVAVRARTSLDRARSVRRSLAVGHVRPQRSEAASRRSAEVAARADAHARHPRRLRRAAGLRRSGRRSAGSTRSRCCSRPAKRSTDDGCRRSATRSKPPYLRLRIPPEYRGRELTVRAELQLGQTGPAARFLRDRIPRADDEVAGRKAVAIAPRGCAKLKVPPRLTSHHFRKELVMLRLCEIFAASPCSLPSTVVPRSAADASQGQRTGQGPGRST